jgi:hypothetical protein
VKNENRFPMIWEEAERFLREEAACGSNSPTTKQIHCRIVEALGTSVFLPTVVQLSCILKRDPARRFVAFKNPSFVRPTITWMLQKPTKTEPQTN